MAIRKKNIAKMVEKAFDILGDIPINVSFVKYEDNGIDPIKEAKINVRAVREYFNQDDIRSLSFSALIQPTDIKLLVLINKLPVVSTRDKVIIDGKKMSVIGIQKDPADILWIIGVR